MHLKDAEMLPIVVNENVNLETTHLQATSSPGLFPWGRGWPAGIMRDLEESLDEINLGFFIQNSPLEHFEVLLNAVRDWICAQHFLNFFEATWRLEISWLMKCVLGSMIFRFFLLASKTDKPLGDNTTQNQSVKFICWQAFSFIRFFNCFFLFSFEAEIDAF